MSSGVAEVSRPSARARARRPQLVPRAPAPVVDPDVAAVAARTGDLPIEPAALPQTVIEPVMTLAPPQTATVVPLPTAPAPTPQPALMLRAVTYEDFDRMWDWARQDVAGAHKFLGAAPTHSRAMFDYFQKILHDEAQGTALLRAIELSGDTPLHVGLIVINPISRSANQAMGMVHCYLAPFAQGSLPQMLPALMDVAAEQLPELTLVVGTTDYALAKLLQPHGFHLSIALTRPARKGSVDGRS